MSKTNKRMDSQIFMEKGISALDDALDAVAEARTYLKLCENAAADPEDDQNSLYEPARFHREDLNKIESRIDQIIKHSKFRLDHSLKGESHE